MIHFCMLFFYSPLNMFFLSKNQTVEIFKNILKNMYEMIFKPILKSTVINTPFLISFVMQKNNIFFLKL